jgi:hypothetical protein
MGGKRSDMPAKGTTTLASLYSKRASTDPQQVIDIEAANTTQNSLDVPGPSNTVLAELSAAVATDPEPASTKGKRKRFRLEQDNPALAYFEFKKFKKEGRNQLSFHCLACDAGKDPKWAEFKSDAALKHIGKCFDDAGSLVGRNDRYRGTMHNQNVSVYEEALKTAGKPSTILH